jgi:hypothetical protein
MTRLLRSPLPVTVLFYFIRATGSRNRQPSAGVGGHFANDIARQEVIVMWISLFAVAAVVAIGLIVAAIAMQPAAEQTHRT